jgi:hypothetical protein
MLTGFLSVRGKAVGAGDDAEEGFCETNPILRKPAWKSYQNKANLDENEPNFASGIALPASPKRLSSNSICVAGGWF